MELYLLKLNLLSSTNGDQVGVQPDHYIPLRVEDIAAGSDAALELRKELITKENKTVASHKRYHLLTLFK